MKLWLPSRGVLKRMGLTLDQYRLLWTGCNGHCPICLKPMGRSRVPAVDHNHRTGLIRGLICSPCNNWLGFEHDDADRFARASHYLYHPPALDILGMVYVPHSIGASHEETA